MENDCLDCGKALRPGGEAIQVRTGYINESGDLDAAEDVAYYHVTCFNRLTGRNFPPSEPRKV